MILAETGAGVGCVAVLFCPIRKQSWLVLETLQREPVSDPIQYSRLLPPRALMPSAISRN